MYLSKQTAALREVNDSRLRIYEQLEVSIQELEKNNQRLSAESQSDKRKIKSLTNTLESLETKCEDLQRQQQQHQHQQQQQKQQQQQQQQRGRSKKKSLISDEQLLRRSLSCEAQTQSCEEDEEEEWRKALVEETEGKVREVRRNLTLEVNRREEMEIQVSCLSQENAVLQEQLNVLRAREEGVVRSLEDELASLDDSTSSRLCRKCLGDVETASNPTLYDLTDSIEDTDASIESVHGECALIRLKNGGYAWGSQESLASIGHVVGGGSGGTSPGLGGMGGVGGRGVAGTDAPQHNSLLSELDTSYRILIEKYEALLEAREQQQQQNNPHNTSSNTSLALIHPGGVDDLSGPMSLMMTEDTHDNTLTDIGGIGVGISGIGIGVNGSRCQRCNTCSCHTNDVVTVDTNRPKSNLLEEFSEVETSSSGFSDGESRTSNKSTQTTTTTTTTIMDDDYLATPTPKCLDLNSPVNPCDRRFQAAPEYKKLFQEIFTVLKKTVDENDDNNHHNQQQLLQQQHNILQHLQLHQQNIEWQESIQQQENIDPSQMSQQQQQQQQEQESHTSTSAPDTQTGVVSGEGIDGSKQLSDEAEKRREENEERRGRRKSRKEQQQQQQQQQQQKDDVVVEKERERVRENTTPAPSDPPLLPLPLITTKPHRPDSLDLISNHSGSSSRASSRQKRRRQRQVQRLQQQLVLDNSNHSYQQQQQQQQHNRHHRREHQPPPQPPQQLLQEDYPNLDIQDGGGDGGNNNNNNNNRSRTFYNSRGGRCEHHRSRKQHRKQQQQQPPQQPRSDSDSRCSVAVASTSTFSTTITTTTANNTSSSSSSTIAPPKINFPSVEVAKLRKLEMSYAEALKLSMSRSQYNRRY
ncbi:hypothetical protein Pmani_013605 [Petrolisthes manimaculis]|uniref:Uncharacterized protein n=1 Tax=Petrolisthes manimaculis TaxID=1843537 RepID=A0AAE1UC06_9EUCA|nr:hypothetical protein Pmani_013605 [Petrolisthes manimaculis]